MDITPLKSIRKLGCFRKFSKIFTVCGKMAIVNKPLFWGHPISVTHF